MKQVLHDVLMMSLMIILSAKSWHSLHFVINLYFSRVCLINRVKNRLSNYTVLCYAWFGACGMCCRLCEDRIFVSGTKSGPLHLSEAFGIKAQVRLHVTVLSFIHRGVPDCLINMPWPIHPLLRVMGISCNIIKPKEVSKLHPLVNIHDLVGALHLPADAVVSPPEVNHALAVAAAGQGNSNSYLSFDKSFII